MVIAGSPRNALRCSLTSSVLGVEHWMDAGDWGPTKFNQTPNTNTSDRGSETTGEKVRGREGNSPDRQLRSQRYAKCGKDVEVPKQPGGWLRSSHSFKECVTAHWSRISAPKM